MKQEQEVAMADGKMELSADAWWETLSCKIAGKIADCQFYPLFFYFPPLNFIFFVCFILFSNTYIKKQWHNKISIWVSPNFGRRIYY